MPAPMRFDRHSLLGGQSDRSGRWPSRVWMIVIPPRGRRPALGRRLQAGPGELEVVAHGVDVAAGAAEVDLPVDVHQGGAARIDPSYGQLYGSAVTCVVACVVLKVLSSRGAGCVPRRLRGLSEWRGRSGGKRARGASRARMIVHACPIRMSHLVRGLPRITRSCTPICIPCCIQEIASSSEGCLGMQRRYERGVSPVFQFHDGIGKRSRRCPLVATRTSALSDDAS